MRPPTRTVLGAALAACALVLGGCADQVVDGRGFAGAAPSGPTGFPSGFPGAPSSAAGTPVGAPPAVQGQWVVDRAGGFRVRMPGPPERTSEPGSFGGYHFVVHVAAVHFPYLALVEGERITPALPLTQFGPLLRGAVGGFVASSGLQLISQSDTTFRGHPGRRAVIERAGTRYVYLVFVYSGAQTYSLLAPQGPRFDALAASFQPI
jgi:hypothetical protein